MKLLINGVLIAVVAGLLYLSVQVHQKRVAAEQQLASLQVRIAALDKENKRLEGDIEYYSLQKNLEKEARARLNVKKPGEQLVILTQQNGRDTSTSTVPAATEKQDWWQSFKNFLSSKFKRD